LAYGLEQLELGGGAIVKQEGAGVTDNIPIIVIVGPTAVGKTALGVALGEQLEGEIISADSHQFYRKMNIGTAKPTPQERSRVRHHLIDIADPDQTVGLARFLQLARQTIQDVAARGKLPFIVGGTGQYIRALLEGWQVPEVPPDPELRRRLEQRAHEDPHSLWAELLWLDPAAADIIDPRNIRRVIRALEVTLKTGRPFSEQRRRRRPPYRTLTLGLTMERQALYARADTRVDAMMGAGLLGEVQSLLEEGYDWSLPAMSALGYIQFRPYFEGERSLEEVVAQIKRDTHAFIRRQYTWFRLSDPQICWLRATDPELHRKALVLIQDFLNAA